MKGVVLSDEEIEKKELLNFTEKFIDTHNSGPKIASALNFIKTQEEEMVLVIKIQDFFNKLKMNKSIESYVNSFKGKYGYWLKHLAKNKEVVDKTFGSMVDLHALKSRTRTLFWANKQMGKTKGDFTKTNIVRSLNTWGHSYLLFDNLLEMMAVDFVRVDAPSVIPFPFKLLREYQKMVDLPAAIEINTDKYDLDV